MDMVLDRLFRQVELRGDLFIRETFPIIWVSCCFATADVEFPLNLCCRTLT